jgi:NADPH:quinone reductase-like Zn-dependent oxidoreductase
MIFDVSSPIWNRWGSSSTASPTWHHGVSKSNFRSTGRYISMKAIAVNANGDVPALIDAHLPPTPGPGEVQVAVAAAGLNPIDWKIADGLLGPARAFPLILGRDVASTVTAVGGGVRLERGDRVCGWATGSYAELVLTTADLLGKVPGSVDLAAAAAVPTPGVTAYQLHTKACDARAKRVLIVGATGSVGAFTTQLMSGSGIEVIATARPDKAELMKSLGAAEIIDYAVGPVVEQVLSAHSSGVDLLIDLVNGPDGFAEMTRAVRRGGTAVSTIGAADEKKIRESRVACDNFVMFPDSRALESLLRQIQENTLSIVGRTEIPLEKAVDALAANREGRSTGKTVLML